VIKRFPVVCTTVAAVAVGEFMNDSKGCAVIVLYCKYTIPIPIRECNGACKLIICDDVRMCARRVWMDRICKLCAKDMNLSSFLPLVYIKTCGY